MDVIATTRMLALAGLAVCVLGIAFRLRDIMNRPFRKDLARARGSAWRGVLYAFTLGMAPWEKESGRRHWVAYLRGVAFHVGIFAAFAILLASPWLDVIPLPLIWLAGFIAGIGGIAGLLGVAMRWLDANERALSVADDYFSVALTAVFTALACLVLAVRPLLPLFYIVTAAMLVYIPFSKIRHCVYFFYARFFFGLGFGHRGVIGQPHGDLIK